jgi:hypothetical protein
MKTGLVGRSAIALIIAASIPGMALAQDASEIVGQPIQVTTNGIMDTVYLDAGGAARLVTPEGTTMPATWSAAGGQLCLNNGSAQECWPYNAPFQANQPVTLTSSCNATSTWLAQAVNGQQPQVSPERGR